MNINSTPSNKIQISNKTKIKYKKNFFIMWTSIFYLFALPPTLVRSLLNIKISKQHCKINSFYLFIEHKKSMRLHFF